MTEQNDVAPGRWLAYTPAILFIVLFLLSVQLIRRADRGRMEVRKIEQVRLLTLRSLSWLQDAETGQRGYLITGSEVLEAQYRESSDSAIKSLVALNALTQDEEAQQFYLRTLIPLVQRRLDRLEDLVQLHREKPEQAIKNMPIGPGVAMMDSARRIFARMLSVEARTQERREAVERADQLLLQWALGIGFVIAGIVSYLIGSRLAENALQHWMLNADLKARIAMLGRQDPTRRPGEGHSPPKGNQTVT
jgi:CHASE3 domain sensor protein